jgi:hypothetical protein
MATLTVQNIVRAGLEPSYDAAAAGGDEFANTGDEFIHVKNGDGSSHTVTIETPATVDGLAVADRDVAIPAGEERMIGPFPGSTYNDGDGMVQLTYDGVTSVTLAVLKVTGA